MRTKTSRSAVQLPSVKFARIYKSLPSEARLTLFEEHLVPLLNAIDGEKSDSVLSAAKAFQTRFLSVPALDLKGKKKEINMLLDGLQKDSKISIKERSNRQELLEELFDSLTNWLNVIWSVVYEHNSGYIYAHTCLLFVADVMSKLDGLPAGCKCPIMNMPVNVTIKNRGGKIIKEFSVSGPHGVERILLWIWRDLFVSLLARGASWEKEKTSELLESIEDVLEWTALERLLYGGKESLFGGNGHGDDEEDDDDDDSDDDSIDEESGEEDEDDNDNEDGDEGEQNEDDSTWGAEADEDETVPHSCRLHAHHWTTLINDQRLPLQKIVEARLRSIFEVTPSLPLFMTILSISRNVPESQKWLFSTTAQNATNTPETLAAALEIFSAESEVPRVLALLDSHSYLLRPRDAQSLQLAVVTIAESPQYHARAIPIITKELSDSIREIHVAVRSGFSHIDEAKNQRELAEILKLRAGRARRQRVEAWIEAVSSPPAPLMHPMAVAAAMMMGLPVPPPGPQGEDPELIAALDMSSSYDRDLEDLRDEFRPKLSERFDGWCKVANNMKGGSGLLTDAYASMLKLMPFMRASDIVREMLTGLEDRSSMSHIYSALETLTSFCKTQQQIILQHAREKKARSMILASKASTRERNKAKVPQLLVPGGINDVD